jgi:hypothetical protein
MSNKFARNLALAFTLSALSGVASHADTTSSTTTLSATSVTGADPVPTDPNQKPAGYITILLTMLGMVL